MIPMTLQQAAIHTKGILLKAGGYLDDDPQTEEIIFSDIATDTRHPMHNSLFIALKGDNFNAHDYLDKAMQQGAVACMLEEVRQTPLPVLKVDNTLSAMGRLAQSLREQLSLPLIGITGSCGKTTVKEMLASILSAKGQVLATAGNFNNAVGVPLTLFRLSSDDQFGVIEMGASRGGDIDQIAQLVRPDVALITNVSPAHLLGLGSIEGVANVKGEILKHLQQTGTAILEQDSPWLTGWVKGLGAQQQLKTFSRLNPKADYYATEMQKNAVGQPRFVAHTPIGEISIRLSVSGLHHVNNALAAMAAAVVVGATLLDCQQGLAKVHSVKGRLQMTQMINGCRIIDDSYNANPASLSAAMEVLKDLSGKRLLVLGDMGELAAEAESAHFEAGQEAKRIGLDGLYATGPLSIKAVQGFGKGGVHFSSREKLAEALIQLTGENTTQQWTLLVKGSRSSAMDKLVSILQREIQGKGQKLQQEGTPPCY